MTTVDIHRSPGRALLLLALACGFVAMGAWAVLAPPGGASRPAPGALEAVWSYAGLLFFGLVAVLMVRRLFQRGPLVSVGARGIFDRRLSTDWIPWPAVTGVAIFGIAWWRCLVILTDPEADPALPWTRWARFVMRLNRPFGPRGYWMTAAELEGGFEALSAAIDAGRRATAA